MAAVVTAIRSDICYACSTHYLIDLKVCALLREIHRIVAD